jgi:hypothetical protein
LFLEWHPLILFSSSQAWLNNFERYFIPRSHRTVTITPGSWGEKKVNYSLDRVSIWLYAI